MEYILVIIVGYIIGNINPAILIARHVKDIDIRDVNSKNAGTSNAALTLGMRYGVLVGILDLLKGLIPGLLLKLLLFPDNNILWVVGGLSIVAGHVFPLFYDLKGGKGTATFGGLVLALIPIPGLILFVLFWIITYFSDYIAIATIAIIITVPVIMAFQDYSAPSVFFVIVFCLLSIYKHLPNLIRIYKGEEKGLSVALKK